MASEPGRYLLDQNIPYPAVAWLREHVPGVSVFHARDLQLGRAPDATILARAAELDAVVITYDEDFADQRQFPVGSHAGVVRLRVAPTTDEVSIAALRRLLAAFTFDQLHRSLTIVDAGRIRMIAP
ncbi:MAG: DUF5615 family PIN-like protein [Planctomycetota bacterium]